MGIARRCYRRRVDRAAGAAQARAAAHACRRLRGLGSSTLDGAAFSDRSGRIPHGPLRAGADHHHDRPPSRVVRRTGNLGLSLAAMAQDPPTERDSMNGPLLLDVRDISIAFGGLKAVQHFSLQLPPGALYGLIGP